MDWKTALSALLVALTGLVNEATLAVREERQRQN